MSTVKGTLKNGQIILDEPADWPEGCRVVVEPVEVAEDYGMREEDWSNSPEAIADWLKWYDSFEPLDMTPEEEAVWKRAMAHQMALETETR